MQSLLRRSRRWAGRLNEPRMEERVDLDMAHWLDLPRPQAPDRPE
jgi:hypothetical protein